MRLFPLINHHVTYVRAHKSVLTPQTAHLTSYTLTTKPHLTSLCSPRTSYSNSIRPSQLAPHTSNMAVKRISHSIMVLCKVAICMLVFFVFSMDTQATGSMHSIWKKSEDRFLDGWSLFLDGWSLFLADRILFLADYLLLASSRREV